VFSLVKSCGTSFSTNQAFFDAVERYSGVVKKRMLVLAMVSTTVCSVVLVIIICTSVGLGESDYDTFGFILGAGALCFCAFFLWATVRNGGELEENVKNPI
jgi:hypothetical protein